MTLQEIWKDIPGFENWYQVSNLGNVRSVDRYIKNRFFPSVILKAELGKRGYLMIGLYKDGEHWLKSVHRLVTEAFIPNPDNKSQINHKDGNKQNNNVKNLEWCTCSENQQHKFTVLKHKSVNFGKFGAANHNSKSVAQIKAGQIIKTFGGIREAGRQTQIEPSSIIRCLKGKYSHAGGFEWKYITK